METIERPIYRIQRLPRWVKRREIDFGDQLSHSDSPEIFLLADYQEQVKDREIRGYFRSVHKINDSSKLEEASLFLRELRAGNECLIFHRVDLIRNGRRITALNPENISVYRREKSLTKHIINNRITVCHSIDDLRVGDVIDYHVTHLEYATEHPIAVKQYWVRFWLNWNCIVLKQNVRIVNRSRRTLVLHHHAIEQGKEKNSYAELMPLQECEHHYADLVPKSISNTAPDWVRTDFLLVTPVASWSQISRYCHDTYADAAIRNGDLDCSAIDRIKLTGIEGIDALRIIRFVQNEIRYLSVSVGIYSHTPKPPRYILRKGAGDCKGKSNLLVVLLNSIGVTANPVLVNTSIGNALNHYKASACHFNHVIVRVEMTGKTYYFDPTVQHQAGDFEHAAQQNLGYGLNLTAAGEDLVKLPWDISRKVFEIKHRFDFREAEKGNGNVAITRKYRAHHADRMRSYIASSETHEVQKDYFDRAVDDSGLELRTVKPFSVVKDHADTNLLVTEEQYEIINMKPVYEDDEVYVTTTFHLGFPYPSDEKFQLQISADGEMEHYIEVLYPFEISEEPRSGNSSNPYFKYRREVWPEGKVLNFYTQVIPRRDVVDHKDITKYDSAARRLYSRRHNKFRCQSLAVDSTIWEGIGVQLLLGALIAAVIAVL
jgi:hypothetical protein